MQIKVKITRDGSNRVMDMDIEEYLRGVVPSEIGDKSAMAALKAQTIAARTYAVQRIKSTNPYDVDDTSKYQAFKLVNIGKTPNSDIAIRETAGVVLMYGNSYISAVYSSANGGRTVSAEKQWGSKRAYLIEQDDPWDKAAGYKKYGHGVGMSQRGAQWAGAHGVGYEEILAFYYPGAKLIGNYGKATTPTPKPEKKPEPKSAALTKYGDIGDAVEVIQVKLNEIGGYKLKVDGIFGPKTKAAVRDFQRKKKLEVDGIVGPQTRKALGIS